MAKDNMMEDRDFTYFQYHTENDYPVFLCLEEGTLSESLMAIIKELNFRTLSGSEIDDLQGELSRNPSARMLKIVPASFKLSRQIMSASESDRYGSESILPKDGYKVYRYKKYALAVYSYASEVWECGVTEEMGEGEAGRLAARTVLNRYLGWALAPLGVVGFWGVPVEEGMVVLKQKESQGEAVFLDLQAKLILSCDGGIKIPLRFKILRLDNHLKNKNILMSSEELMSFLSVHCTYFDPTGHSRPVRQLLQAISRRGEGLVHPRESFQPRVNKEPEL